MNVRQPAPPTSNRHRLPLGEIARRYDRIARFYRVIEPLFLIHNGARRRAVRALALEPGDAVLELGCGTGRNFPYLTRAIGPTGRLIGVDASPGMLARARRLVRARGWSNAYLLDGDAARLALAEDFDAVLFSLSYSVIPDRVPAAEAAWARLGPGGRLVVMDLGLQLTRFGPHLRPLADLLLKLAPGDPDSRPWDDLAHLAPVSTERFLAGLYYTCTLTKPVAARST